ncbi:MAG TPA: class I SAM-dependent methyltransferase, partial [Chitinophagaceae bacterium]|nr:class I SAM-dependent methyltransferase [Chitinophagaceae bacterium]
MFTQDGPDEQESGAYYQSENYISHSDTRKGIVNRLYHLVRGITLNGKYRVVQKETRKSQGHILDLGCGTGAFLHTMSKKGWDATGLEPDAQARKKATALYQLNVQEPAGLYQLPKGSFDAITLWHVLEHVHDLHKYLDTMRDLLRDEGRIFVAVPNHTSTDAAMYQSYWAAYDVPRHLYHFSPACMKALMLRHGLQVRRILPMWFDAYYVSLLSEQYKGSGAFKRLLN